MQLRSHLIHLQSLALVGVLIQFACGGNHSAPVATGIPDQNQSTDVLMGARQATNSATVTLSPAATTINSGESVAYYAAVTGSASQTVTWTVDGVSNGNASVGVLSPGSNGAHVTYVAPANSGAHTIKATATNAAGAKVSGSTSVTVTGAAVTITSVYLNDLSVNAGTSGQVGFQPVPTSGKATDFVWSTSAGTDTSPGTVGGSSLNGTVSTSGLYTLPASPIIGSKVYRVWAASKANSLVRDFCYVSTTAPATACSIAAQPQSTTVNAGQTASFTVTAAGTVSHNYQWRKNGAAISGATSATYITPATSTADSGSQFSVVVNNTTGSVTSNAATLTVKAVATAQPGWVGFGKNTTGGTGKTVVHVTNLNDSGAGSFRDACGSDRIIVFDVGGTIPLTSADVVLTSVANLTIDGSTAPAPGITFTQRGINFRSSNNIVVTNIRHRGGFNGGAESGGCITFFPSCFNIVVDHCSFSGFQDEAIDFWNGNHDVTIQHCIVGAGMSGTGHNYECLIGEKPYNFTVYSNLFHNGEYRNPAIGYDDANGTTSPVLCAEVINNVTWKYTAYGITVYWGAKANVIGNYLYTQVFPGDSNRAVNTDAGGQSYASGNFSKDGSSVSGTQSSAFSVPAYAQVTATSATAAAAFVKANAGCRVGGLDATDRTIINDLTF